MILILGVKDNSSLPKLELIHKRIYTTNLLDAQNLSNPNPLVASYSCYTLAQRDTFYFTDERQKKP